jgi:Galactose oxidase, central domain/Kelch motif
MGIFSSQQRRRWSGPRTNSSCKNKPFRDKLSRSALSVRKLVRESERRLTFNRFGGTNGQQWFNDVWSYDPRTNIWTQQECIGYIPAPREGHSAAVVGDVMYIFGGRTEEGTDLGDLAAFRLSTRRWFTFQNMGPSPSPRSGHSMTAHGKQIIVLAGEPSSAPRDASELSMVYILDTAKIRYPNEQPLPANKAEQGALAGNGRPNTDSKNAVQAGRSVSREGQLPHAGHMQKSESSLRDNTGPAPMQSNKAPEGPTPINTFGPRPVRASVGQAPVGPPPQGQAPDPRMNNPTQPPPHTDSQTRTPPKETRAYGPPVDTLRAASVEGHRRTPSNRDSPKDLASKIAHQTSPEAQGRRTPTQQPALKAKAMEAGEAAPLMSGPSRQRSLRSQRGHGSIDSSEEGLLGRNSSGRIHSGDGMADVRSLRSLGDEPKSPRLTAHQEALIKELEATKSRNAWYASELALARKAGFHSSGSSSPMFDERAVNQLGEEDRPLIEAFLAMRAELGKMQQTVEQQAVAAAKQVAEVEHQRDAAVSEAAYARAKLAAHSGSAHGTPQPDSTRDIDDGAERTTDISRRLALALAAQHEHKSKLELLANELQAEKRAREFAEESAEAAQKRLDETSEGRNPMELEALRAELHEAQIKVREEAARGARAEEKLSMSQVDRDEIFQQHEETSNRLAEHIASLGALQAAVAASSEKSSTLERHLEQEREQKESLERKLVNLRAEHEECTTELESTARRLRETEELAETHAKEATTHREAFVNGLSRATHVEGPAARDAATEQRILALQQSADRAHSLAKNNREATDLAAQKLRSAEERIAGLEAYQEQSSREGLQIRRQLQAALKEAQTTQAQNREMKAQLENHQRDANALAIQHGALKDVLSERSLHNSDSRRSPMFESNSPGPRLGTPDQNRLRELEQQLQSSMKAHEETKGAFESREQDADRRYREKLEQLENDYQSAVHYVKRTEKMLKWMNEELSKYKTQNTRLQSELEAIKGGDRSASQNEEDAAKLAAERDALQKSLDDIQKRSGLQLSKLESQLSSISAELAAAQAERDQHRLNHEELTISAQQTRSELAQMQSENQMLESRAMDAEQKVTMLLDQVGQSVGNYRRQSQIHPGTAPHVNVNGDHDRQSPSSLVSSGGRDRADSSSQDEMFTDNRGSLALDSLASELDALKSRWESTSRSYRLSNQFDFEKTPTKDVGGAELSENLANWRKRLEDEERVAKSGGGAVKEPVPREGDMI